MPEQNGAAIPTKPVADQIREAIAQFNAFIDAKEKDPKVSPVYIRLMRAMIPPLTRWRYDETARDTSWEERRDAFVLAMSFIYSNEMYRPGMEFWDRIGFVVESVSEITARATHAIHMRELAYAEAAKRAEAKAAEQPVANSTQSGHA